MMCSSDPGDNPNNGYAPYEDLCDVATFEYTGPNSDSDPAVPVDPRMLMVIHEAFGLSLSERL